MATRDLTISTETASFTTEDFDEQLMYTGASVPLAAIRTADIVSRTVYKSGSAGASEAAEELRERLETAEAAAREAP